MREIRKGGMRKKGGIKKEKKIRTGKGMEGEMEGEKGGGQGRGPTLHHLTLPRTDLIITARPPPSPESYL